MNKAMIFQSSILRTKCNIIRPSPTMFFYPGLTSKPFWDTNELKCDDRFKWINDIEANISTIRKEYENIKQVAKSDYNLNDNEHKLHKGNWEWYNYISQGKRQSNFAVHAPETTRILESIPDLMTNIPIAYSFFSRLHGESSINPHSGICNLRLRVHFPLHVPVSDCGIRVGNETRSWKSGECLILDDSYDHEVWNRSPEERSMLLFDIWHPDISIEETEAIVHMFQSTKGNNKK